MAIARGQITIVDLNDAVAVSAMLTSNQPTTQIYVVDKKSYTPDWTQSPYLVITPEVYIAGTTSSVISRVKSVQWKVNGEDISEVGGSAAASSPYALTIKQNMTTATQYVVEFTGIYVDPDSSLETPVKALMTFTKSDTAGASPVVQVNTPNGNNFINALPTSLTAEAIFLRGGTEDTSGVTYQWFKQESSGQWTKLTNANGFSGVTTKTLTLQASAVLNFINLKVEITDTEAGSATQGNKFIGYCSFLDQTDPIQVVISSTTGDKIVNGTGSTTLRADLWQAGSEIDKEGNTYNYTWYKYDKTGTPDEDWNTTGSKSGKSIEVQAADIDVKSTFVCEITKK